MTQRALIAKGNVAIVLLAVFFVAWGADAAMLAERLSGRILLQVESHGEAWYVDPLTHERFFLGRPSDAFALMRQKGLGITTKNLLKIPRADSDDIGDARFTERFLGRILLQVESHGEAWYVAPSNQRRYFLGRPDDAFRIMRSLGLGITNTHLSSIAIAPSSLAVPTDLTQRLSAPRADTTGIALRDLINAERGQGAVASVALHDVLTTAAQGLTDDMVARNYFALETPEGRGAKALMQAAGYAPRASGILIASGPDDAAAAFALWNASPEGRALFLNAAYEEIGVGKTQGDAATGNVWVLFLASSQERYEERVGAALSDITAIRNALLVRVNQERAKQHRAPLAMHTLLEQSAQKKAEDMFVHDYFAHESPGGVAPHDLITSTGYAAKISAENLAKGPESVTEVMDGWMQSPGHRENILLDGITEAGFGLRFGTNASGFQILWVQHFGKR